MKKSIILLAIVLMSGYSFLNAQCLFEEDTSSSSTAKATAEAKNGFYLTTSGTIRVLVVYIEVDYDITPSNDRFPTGTSVWAKNQLPTYKDNMFDLNWTGAPQGIMTKYFAECSFNTYKVLGDYVNQVITVKESDLPIVSDFYIKTNAFNQLNLQGYLNTNGSSTIQDLDNWVNKTIQGEVNIQGPDTPYSYDHVMFIMRNYHGWMDISGMSSWSSAGTLLGFQSDTYSAFNGGGAIPFNIVRHEYSHLLFGSNNFHTGGSHSAGGTTFIPDQMGWSMMGGSGSSFQTCNAWDRDRFDWKGFGKSMNISSMDINGVEINGDLDATNPTHAGVYVIRDFVTTGDALKIKLPFIPSGEYQEYIWVENHQTGVNNGSDYDHFVYESDPCMSNSTPGLYMYLQAGKDIISGGSTYSQYGHYLRFIPADGMYDLQYETTLMQNNWCINNGWYFPFEKLPQFANPLTGSVDLEHPASDNNANNTISRAEHKALGIEKINGQYYNNLPYLGHSRHAFTLNGGNKIGLGYNPSANSMLTLERDASSVNPAKQNRVVRLNGVSVTILAELPDGSIKVEVKFDETDVNNNVRWAGNDIQLPAISGSNGYSLNLLAAKTITIDQGYTPTRIDFPMIINGEKYFVDNTVFTTQSYSYFHLEPNATVNVINGSALHLLSDSKMELEAGATLHLFENSSLIIENGAELNLKPGAQLIIDEGATVTYKNSTTNKGLLVGTTTNTGNPAIVEVYGNMNFISGSKWEHNRDGFYRFHPTHTLSAQPGVPITFKGLGKTVKFLELESATTLTINGNVVNWSLGLVQYGLGAIVKMNTLTEFHGTSVTFNSQPTNSPTSTGIFIDNPKTFITQQCDWLYFDKAIKITNAGSPVLLLASIYKDNTTAIDLDTALKITIAGSYFTSTITGATGIKAANSFGVIVSNSEILGINGVRLTNVKGFYLNNSDINYSTTGIYGTDALVFLRTGSKVHNCDNGVELFGSYDYAGANYTSMLTMGDAGCGSVYGNLIGIAGRDFILNIDAEQHAIDRGIPSQVIPNRFDNNSNYTFHICYTDPSVAPSQINAQGNYWGNGNILPSNYYIKASTTCITKPNQGTNISLISSNYSTCDPVNSCMDCNISPGTTFPGNGGGLSNAAVNVRNAFENANAPFVVEDMVLTRLGFNDLSAVEIIKDTTDSSWTARSVNNEVFALETEGVHRIQVSKAIKAAAVDPNAKMSYLPNDIFAGVTAEEKIIDDFTLYPNPANEIVNITTNNDELFNYVLVNVLGEEIIKGTFNKTIAIKTKNLSGVYFIEVTNASGRKKIKKLVVNH